MIHFFTYRFKRLISLNVIFFLVIGFSGAFYSSCSSEFKEENGNNESEISNEKELQRVEVVSPELRSFSAELELTGVAKPNKETKLFAMESGFLKTLFHDMGDRVNKGEVLAELSNPELYRKKQELEAVLAGKESIYNRLKKVFEKSPSITPLKDLDDAKAEFLKSEAALKGVQDRLEFLKIVSPFSGVITKRYLDEGAVVQNALSNGTALPLFDIQEIDPIRIEFPVPERESGYVSKGLLAKVSFPELSIKDIKSEVSRTSSSLDQASRSMTAQIDISNPTFKIKPGTYVKVKLAPQNKDSVISLPIEALFLQKDAPYLLVVKDGVVQEIELKKGLTNKAFFEVLNEEIKSDMSVIVVGKSLVKVGQQVIPQKKKSP